MLRVSLMGIYRWWSLFSYSCDPSNFLEVNLGHHKPKAKTAKKVIGVETLGTQLRTPGQQNHGARANLETQKR